MVIVPVGVVVAVGDGAFVVLLLLFPQATVKSKTVGNNILNQRFNFNLRYGNNNYKNSLSDSLECAHFATWSCARPGTTLVTFASEVPRASHARICPTWPLKVFWVLTTSREVRLEGERELSDYSVSTRV